MKKTRNGKDLNYYSCQCNKLTWVCSVAFYFRFMEMEQGVDTIVLVCLSWKVLQEYFIYSVYILGLILTGPLELFYFWTSVLSISCLWNNLYGSPWTFHWPLYLILTYRVPWLLLSISVRTCQQCTSKYMPREKKGKW